MNIHIKKIILIILFPVVCFSAEYDVGGGGEDYSTITALTSDTGLTLSAGDIVNIYPGAYTDEPTFGSRHVGTEANPIIVRGVNSSGVPLTSVAVDNFSSNPVFNYSSPDAERTEGHFYFYSDSAWIQLSGICLKNMPKAAAWQAMKIKGDNITIRHNLFKDNYGAIGSTSECDKVTIEYNEFSGDNYSETSHPSLIYTIGTEAVIRYNYIHGYAGAGESSHIIKMRDCSNTVSYNYIVADQTSRTDDILEFCQAESGQTCYGSGKQDATVISNILVCASGADVKNFIKFSSDQDPLPRGEGGDLKIINNTIVNLSTNTPNLLNAILAVDDTFEFSNNIVDGFSHIFPDSDWDCELAGYNNILPVGITLYPSSGTVSGFTGTISDDDPEFVSTSHGSTGFHIESTSPAVGEAYASTSISPAYTYKATADKESRLSDDDIGAYEYEAESSTPNLTGLKSMTGGTIH